MEYYDEEHELAQRTGFYLGSWDREAISVTIDSTQVGIGPNTTTLFEPVIPTYETWGMTLDVPPGISNLFVLVAGSSATFVVDEAGTMDPASNVSVKQMVVGGQHLRTLFSDRQGDMEVTAEVFTPEGGALIVSATVETRYEHNRISYLHLPGVSRATISDATGPVCHGVNVLVGGLQFHEPGMIRTEIQLVKTPYLMDGVNIWLMVRDLPIPADHWYQIPWCSSTADLPHLNL